LNTPSDSGAYFAFYNGGFVMSFEGYMLAIELPFLFLLYYIFIYKN